MKRLILIFLAVVLAAGCAGCAWMDGNYVSVTPHQVDYDQTSDGIQTVSSYAQLRSAVTDLVDSVAEEGLFYLVDYPLENAVTDMPLVIDYACQKDPLGTYAVESIEYTFGTSGSLNALSVSISYRHTQAEISQIRTVRGISGAGAAIAEALANCDGSIVLMITSYQETDFVQWIEDYAGLHPNIVMEIPQTTVQVCPETGTTRVVELQFSYQTSRDALRQMQNKVSPIFSSAALYVSTVEDQRTKYSQLFSFLMERFDYQIETSLTPAYSLLLHGVGDSKAFAQVYAAMCQQSGLDCVSVSGTRNGESRFWNIVLIEDTYYHVDLLNCARKGEFLTLADDEMNGYVWDYSAYPACGVPVDSEESE